MTQRQSLAAAYIALIGYDPFQDSPEIDPRLVAATLADYLALPEYLATLAD
jgi:hypothetical protein